MGEQQGWTISQVEALIGLSRRDIQRCCYEGKGGVGILSPEDSKWGRRTYSAEDLARLFIVAQLKATGLSLPEAKRELEERQLKQYGDDDFLQDGVSRLSEELERIEDLLLAARAFLNRKNPPALKAIIADHLEKTNASKTEWQKVVTLFERYEVGGLPNNLRSLILQQLDSSGLSLAIELWLGVGSAERLRNELADASR